MAAALLLVGIGSTTACTTFEWMEDPKRPTVNWRGRQAFHTANDTILATSESTAADAARFLERCRAAMAGRGVTPGRGVVLAVAYDDDLLFGAPEPTIRRTMDLHEQAVGEDSNRREGMRLASKNEDITKEEAMTLLAPLACGGIPRSTATEELGLPSELCRTADWIFLLPTDGCVADATNAMLDLAATKKGFGASLLLALVPSSALEKGRSAMRAARNHRLLDVFVAEGKARGSDPDILRAALAEVVELPSRVESGVIDRSQ